MQNVYSFVGSANHTSPKSHAEESVSCRSGGVFLNLPITTDARNGDKTRRLRD
jgi:hypothetical protein